MDAERSCAEGTGLLKTISATMLESHPDLILYLRPLEYVSCQVT